MWNGALSPNMVKKLTQDDVSYDPDNTDDPESMPPEEVIGTLSVKLGAGWYDWPGVTYDQYLEFEAAGFSRSWINDNLSINYVGDWGWPYGRAHNVRASRSGTFFSI